MAQVISDQRDIEFVVHEILQAQTLAELNDDYADFNNKTIDMVIKEAKNLAIKELLPINKEGDEVGCTLENGKVSIPPSFKRVYDLFNEGEWLAPTEDPQWGGQGMPFTVAAPVSEYFNGANYPFMMYCSLTQGAGHLIEKFGTQEQKEIYLKNMYTGKWTGTMLLTEPGAGSDVGALTTKAIPNDDGTYNIVGRKNLYLRRRTGSDRKYHPSRSGAHRRGTCRHQGHLLVPGPKIQSKYRRLVG